jgi:hypothetical protein
MARSGQKSYTTEVAGDAGTRGPALGVRASQRGKGAKPDAPRGTGRTSGRGSTGKKKSGNRPGPSGTGAKKQMRGSSGRRRSGSRSGGGRTNKKD